MQEPPRLPVRRCLLCALAAAVLAGIVIPAPHAQADAPPCRYDISADTVLDNDTGLTWQRAVDASIYTHSQATSYCAGLILADNGWRLPSIQELQTIVDESRVNPAIDQVAFPSTPSSYFWSSSLYAGGPGFAWLVNFNGGIDAVDVDDPFRVRCVR